MKFHFITVVWGKSYVDLFLNVSLVSQLSPGNLPAFGYIEEAVYKIYTHDEDAKVIARSPVFLKLSSIIRAEIIIVSASDNNDKFGALAEYCNLALEDVDKEKAAFAMVAADMVFSDGSFRRLYEILVSGKRAIMVPEVRVIRETFVSEFLNKFYSSTDCVAVVNAKDLASLALKHLHPIVESFTWNSSSFKSPSAPSLFWNLGDEGLVCRSFYIHPLVVNPQNKGKVPSFTIDGDYTALTCPNDSDIYIVENSDEIVLVTPSDLSQTYGEFPRRRHSIIGIAFWGKYNANDRHYYHMKHIMRIYGKTRIDSCWQRIERSSERIIQLVLKIIEDPIFEEKVIQRIRRVLDKKIRQRRLIVFGSGISGERVIDFLSRMGLTPDSIVDNNEQKWGNMLRGIPIKAPKDLISDSSFIIIAAPMWREEIAKQLEEMGLIHKTDFVESVL